jgi:hypothetical protein
MILTAVTPERGEKTYHRWIAIWRLKGGVMHQTLPMMVGRDTAADAEKWAVANPPVWMS